MKQNKYPTAFAFVLSVFIFWGLLGNVPRAQEQGAAKISGTVLDEDDKPISQTTVSIYTAAPRTGGGVLGPFAYPDCSKNTVTDTQGRFVIEGLDPALIFRVLAVAKGFQPEFVAKVDPTAGKSLVVVLKPVFEVDKPECRLLGRVIDAAGNAVVGAVVKVKGVTRGQTTRFGNNSDFESAAVSDETGNFTIRSWQPFDAAGLEVEARGLAKGIFARLSSGAAVHELKLSEGASVKGRILQTGKPMAGIEIGLAGANRSAERFVGNYAVSTDAEGRFLFANLPPRTEYHLFAKMKSLGEKGALPVRRFKLQDDNSIRDEGDLTLQPAWVVEGIVKLPEGETFSEKSRVFLSREDSWDSQQADLDDTGHFRFTGVPEEIVTLSVDIQGFQLSLRNASLDLLNPSRLLGRVDGNQTNLVLDLELGSRRNSLEGDSSFLREEPLRGAEVGRPLPNAVAVTGRVEDAETKEPLPVFTVMEGRQPPYNQPVAWIPTRKTAHTNGSFTVYLPLKQSPSVLIEADGYLPQTSGALTAAKTHLTFALKKGFGPRGVLLKPDGQPAEGATVYLADVRQGLYVNGPNLQVNAFRGLHSTNTDAAGRFSFAPPLDDRKIVVLDEEWYAEVSLAELAAQPEVRLQALASVEGQLMIGAKPGARQTVRLQRIQGPIRPDFQGMPALRLYLQTLTDAEGKFVFERVPPIGVEVFHEPKVRDSQAGMTAMSQTTHLMLKPGETRTLTLGGQGRAVIGRMVVKNYDGKIDWRADVQSLESIAPKRDLKSELAKLTDRYNQAVAAAKTEAEKTAANREFQQGRTQLQADLKSQFFGQPAAQDFFTQRRFALNFAQDGTFRVEDVPGGTYFLHVTLREPGEDQTRYSAPPIAMLTREIVVPDSPGGRSDEPFDAGTIELMGNKSSGRK